MAMTYKMFVKFNLNVLTVLCCFLATDGYKIGVGRADCTGPPVEIVFVSKNEFLLHITYT